MSDGWYLPSHQNSNVLYENIDDDGNSLKAIGQGEAEGAGKTQVVFPHCWRAFVTTAVLSWV